jgi:hypothetical protein
MQSRLADGSPRKCDRSRRRDVTPDAPGTAGQACAVGSRSHPPERRDSIGRWSSVLAPHCRTPTAMPQLQGTSALSRGAQSPPAPRSPQRRAMPPAGSSGARVLLWLDLGARHAVRGLIAGRSSDDAEMWRRGTGTVSVPMRSLSPGTCHRRLDSGRNPPASDSATDLCTAARCRAARVAGRGGRRPESGSRRYPGATPGYGTETPGTDALCRRGPPGHRGAGRRQRACLRALPEIAASSASRRVCSGTGRRV